jgi:hypothetical protein
MLGICGNVELSYYNGGKFLLHNGQMVWDQLSPTFDIRHDAQDSATHLDSQPLAQALGVEQMMTWRESVPSSRVDA